MKQISARSIAAAALLLAIACPAIAQGPGGFGPPSPQMKAWADSHKHVQGVQQMLRGLSTIESAPATKLNARQSRIVLGVLMHWKDKPVMTDAQAAYVIATIRGSLKPAQKSALDAASTRGFGGFGGGRPGGPGGAGGAGGWGGGHGGPGGPGGPGGGGWGGGGPGGAGGGGWGGGHGGPGGPGGGGWGGGGGARPAPKEYNPLNPSTLPFQRMQARAQQRLDDLIGQLKATAH